jgi:hypothetical protein
MKLRLALVGLVALGGAALTAGMASAMPLAPLGQSPTSNVESVAVVCGPNGCIRTARVYRRYITMDDGLFPNRLAVLGRPSNAASRKAVHSIASPT